MFTIFLRIAYVRKDLRQCFLIILPYTVSYTHLDVYKRQVYMNQKEDKIYYAHSTDGNHNCLFTQSKLMDQWGDEKQLPMNINSDADDGYPFVLSDGVTIYYASKGNGSLGGYDLFVTRYNINSDTYLTPEQLGMPYNSCLLYTSRCV